MSTYFDLLYDFDILELCLPNYMTDTINLIQFTKNERIPYKMEYCGQPIIDNIRNKLVELISIDNHELFQQPFPNVITITLLCVCINLHDLKNIIGSLPNIKYIYVQSKIPNNFEYLKAEIKCSQLIIDNYLFVGDISELINFGDIGYIRLYNLSLEDKYSYTEIYHNNSKELISIKVVNCGISWPANYIGSKKYYNKIEMIYTNYCMYSTIFAFLKEIKYFKISGCFYYVIHNKRIPIDDFDSNTKDCNAIIDNLYANTI
jgi:hypothetical protein